MTWEIQCWYRSRYQCDTPAVRTCITEMVQPESCYEPVIWANYIQHTVNATHLLVTNCVMLLLPPGGQYEISKYSRWHWGCQITFVWTYWKQIPVLRRHRVWKLGDFNFTNMRLYKNVIGMNQLDISMYQERECTGTHHPFSCSSGQSYCTKSYQLLNENYEGQAQISSFMKLLECILLINNFQNDYI